MDGPCVAVVQPGADGCGFGGDGWCVFSGGRLWGGLCFTEDAFWWGLCFMEDAFGWEGDASWRTLPGGAARGGGGPCGSYAQSSFVAHDLRRGQQSWMAIKLCNNRAAPARCKVFTPTTKSPHGPPPPHAASLVCGARLRRKKVRNGTARAGGEAGDIDGIKLYFGTNRPRERGGWRTAGKRFCRGV